MRIIRCWIDVVLAFKNKNKVYRTKCSNRQLLTMKKFEKWFEKQKKYNLFNRLDFIIKHITLNYLLWMALQKSAFNNIIIIMDLLKLLRILEFFRIFSNISGSSVSGFLGSFIVFFFCLQSSFFIVHNKDRNMSKKLLQKRWMEH